MVPEDLPVGAKILFKPRHSTSYGALPGATALVVLRQPTSVLMGAPMIEVAWIRDGLDNGQKDGAYYCSDFELVTMVIIKSSQPQNRPCSCSFQQLASVGCQYLKAPDKEGWLHS